MTEPTTRTALIEQYFQDKLTRCGGVSLPLNRKRWDSETDAKADPLHRPYGWMAPTIRPPIGPFIFPFCPDVINEQTWDLSDDELDEYLETLGFCVSMHIQHHERTPEDREQLIDRTLYDIGPGSMALLSRVQMKAMDARTEGQ